MGTGENAYKLTQLKCKCMLSFSKKNFTMNFTIMKKIFVKIMLIVCLIFLIICFLLIPDVSISNLSSSTQVTDDDRYLDIYKNGFGDLNMIDFARFFSKLFLMIETKKIDYSLIDSLLSKNLTGKAPKKIHILATWSSGSTFLTKLLTHYPGVFLTFEPLVMTNPRTSLDEKHEDEARQLIKDLFSCNYDVRSKGREFLNFIEDKKNGFGWIVLHNMRTRIFCEAAVDGTNELCFDPNFVQTLCHVHPVQLIKTVRMRTRQIVPLLSSDPDIKFIVLLRDPRAIRSSRNRLPWCTFEACSHPKLLCDHYLEDIQHAKKLEEEYPKNILIVKYEELVSFPEKSIPMIFKVRKCLLNILKKVFQVS